MPLYVFQNPETEEIKEILQGMDDEHIYEEDGIEWKRVFLSPQARVGSFSNLNPDDSRSFSNWIGDGKGGSVGDLWDASKELSQKREKQYGKDPIKEKKLQEYSKTRNGLKHPSTLS